MKRRGYIIRRVLLLFPTILAIYTITFVLMHATPGGPWSNTGDKPIPPIVLQRLNQAYGLDKPLWQQYVNYLDHVLHGDFGPSYAQRSLTVSDIIKQAFPVSFKLGLIAMAIAIVSGVSLGVLGAIKHNTWVDYIASFAAIVGISTPSYVVVSLLVLILASHLHLVPTGGWKGAFSSLVIIPAIALALYPAAVLARYTRSSMLDVLKMDYIRTARAKGLRERRVIVRHAIQNSLLPVVTVAGLILADVITGSFFVESIYSVPGLGRYFVQSITNRDYPVILGTVLLFGVVISVMNLIVDLLYQVLDPRIQT
ncbi:MAG TPA: ABC transporter permease [Nitrolancea sp.]|nr:ABC transporter permease [Nitrolancea sp.]